MSVWESKEDLSENPEVVNLTPYSTMTDEQSSYGTKLHDDDKFMDKKKSREIAKELGFKYSPGSIGETFTDKITGKDIQFSYEFLEHLDKLSQKNMIHYSKYDFLKFYKESPNLFKLIPNKITLGMKNGPGEDNTTGYYNPYTNTIKILPYAFTIPPSERVNLEYTLFHEFSHALDHKLANNKGRYASTLKNSIYSKWVSEDSKIHEEKYGEAIYTSKHSLIGLHEDFAESMAITTCIVKKNNTSTIVKLSNGDEVTFGQWKEMFPNRYEYCKKFLE